MKNAQINIPHFWYILFNLKIFVEIITSLKKLMCYDNPMPFFIVISLLDDLIEYHIGILY